MSREIYTYTNLSKLNTNPLFQKIKKYPHITVSSDLRKGLVGNITFDHVEGIFSNDNEIKMTEISSLAQALNRDWDTAPCKFSEMIMLSEYLRKRILEAGDNKKLINWLTGCKRNVSMLRSSIIMLEQADVKPDEIKANGDRNIELLVDAWKYLEEKDPYMIAFRENMSKKYSKRMWDSVLRTAFKTTDSFENVESIVFHGFYYITPLQQKIMNLLEQAGYNLIFLFPFDIRYPFVYEIWDNTYSEKYGYPPKEEWHMEDSSENDSIGNVFEGNRNVEINNNLTIKEYSSVMDFVNDVKNIREQGYALYSSDFKSANEILQDYFPEEFGERKILSYPVGQFVSVLNQMWDEDSQTVILDSDKLVDCFSSGWLSIDGVSSRQYLKDLIYVLPFFSGCHSDLEWKERIKILKIIRREAIEPFITEKDSDESVARWQEAIENPMANFSMFAVETEKLDLILAYISQLIDMATELFGNNQSIQMSDHINKLDRLLREHGVSSELYEEERELVKDIFVKLGQPNRFDAKCSPADVANALNLFITGRYDDGEIQTNKVGLIYPIYFVDAACIKNNSKIHVCFCDVNTMPGGNKEYVWPLSSGVVERCFAETKNPLLVNVMQIMESTTLCNRYFTYCALKNKDVTISWIREIGESILEPSSYIKLVCASTGIEIIPAKRSTITFSRVANMAYGEGRILEYDNENSPVDMIKEARMAYALCPMKYTLGYVVDKYPTYQSEFQQNYAIDAFILAIYNLMKDKGMTVDQVYNNVMALFPGLRKVEKRQVFDYISNYNREDDYEYDTREKCGEYYYTDQRLNIHYPFQPLHEVVRGRFAKLATPDGRQGLNLYEVLEATTDEEMLNGRDIVKSACMFCQHIDYCRNAIYVSDQEKYYD